MTERQPCVISSTDPEQALRELFAYLRSQGHSVDTVRDALEGMVHEIDFHNPPLPPFEPEDDELEDGGPLRADPGEIVYDEAKEDQCGLRFEDYE